MKSNLMKKMKKTMKKTQAKGMILLEMADDFMDIIQNAKSYKRMNKKR